MDRDTPLGILRRGMSLERDGYRFYTQAAERASSERGRRMFLDLAAQEVDHLRLLLAEWGRRRPGVRAGDGADLPRTVRQSGRGGGGSPGEGGV